MSWLAFVAFVGGFYLGLFVMALLSVAGEAERRDDRW